ncbi:hypothetical protein F5J12DRAFT_855869 [Pisolithus orientalis]|uniref:uncharacterized protein n=1 Tax=Pisolithus orientalis TaxID=936130 RepID=UPI00222434CD|nr:uncharacterized protein F5J12DRAFT_855869 [Pisolithus orientalis]KAI5995300.1 hypothetical protein F5J12DRAFT_855869 [Pisolithus orientalis]
MSTVIDPPTAVRSSQNVTLPPIPELFDPNFLDALLPPPKSTPPQEIIVEGSVESRVENKMMDALRSTVHHKYTENDAPAFSSTLSPTLDAYMGLRKGISGTSVDWYLEEAWAQDPTLTLRLIWRCRSIHDGQGDRELFYRYVCAFDWLYERHPRTAITNLRYLVEPLWLSGLSHGYWKDLLNILALATVDELSVTPSILVRPFFTIMYKQGPDLPLRTMKNKIGGPEPGIMVPVTAEREGIAMLSGYSPSLLQTFMDVDKDWEVVDREGEKVKQAFTPEGMMNKDLQKKSFEHLVVVD